MNWLRLRRIWQVCSLFLLFAITAAPAPARQEVRLGIGYGIAFLPTFMCEQSKLVERLAHTQGLDVTATYHRISGSAEMQDAVLSGSVDIGVFGLQATLLAWEKARGTTQQVFGVSGVTTLPLVLLTNQADIKSIGDFEADDRIAMPALASPQMYALQMAAERAFGPGQYDRLRSLVVAMPHPQAYKALTSGESNITAYFAPPPFTQMALRNAHVTTVLTSVEAFGGKTSFLIAAATKGYLEDNPQMPAIITGALEKAIRLIQDQPDQAAAIYVKSEPSETLNEADVARLLRELRDDFGVDVHGVKANADFMARIGQLRHPPATWADVFIGPVRDTKSD
jgi:NitT/TauT family transport system substrate-binding protein